MKKKLEMIKLTYQEWLNALRVPTPIRNKKSIDVKLNTKIKIMSDSVKKYFELVDEGAIDPNKKVSPPNKAYRILVEYDIKDIKEAVRIYDESLSNKG